jgi:hypothetical protein
MMMPMGLGGRLAGWLLWLAALSHAFEARAEEGGIRLVFDASAEGLPQAEVRTAVEKELGRPLATPSESSRGELLILTDPGRLIVRYRTETGSVERYLPLPGDPKDVPLIVSLAAGNLVRHPSGASAPAAPLAKAPMKASVVANPPHRATQSEKSVPATSPPSEPAWSRQWVGIHMAQDVSFVYGSSVCHQTFGPPENFSCFYAGTDNEPFVHDSQADHEDLDEGPTFATTRLLFSYDYAISPRASVGTRLGYAFGGGPPAGQFPVEVDPSGDPNRIPAGTRGHGGSPFMPVHAELRASYWFLPLTSRSLRAYVGAGFGIAQVDSKHSVAVTDCAETLDPSWNPANGSFDDCMRKTEDFFAVMDGTLLDAWKKMGRGFVTASTGAALPVKGELSVVLNVNAMFMFPAQGFVLEPSVGFMTEL